MPEFPGYLGLAKPDVPVLHVTAVTHRRDPIFQTLVGPGEEHVDPGRTADRGQHPQAGRGRPARLRAQRLLPPGGRRQVPRHPAGAQAHPRGRGPSAAGGPDGLHGVLRAQARDPRRRGRRPLRLERRAVGDDDPLPGRREHGLHPRRALPSARPVGRRPSSTRCCASPGRAARRSSTARSRCDLRERFERSAFMDVDLDTYFPGQGME